MLDDSKGRHYKSTNETCANLRRRRGRLFHVTTRTHQQYVRYKLPSTNEDSLSQQGQNRSRPNHSWSILNELIRCYCSVLLLFDIFAVRLSIV